MDLQREFITYIVVRAFRTQRMSIDRGSHASTNMQTKLAQLLMLSVFTVSSRFNDKEMPFPEPGRMWEAGCNYLASARQILCAYCTARDVRIRTQWGTYRFCDPYGINNHMSSTCDLSI